MTRKEEIKQAAYDYVNSDSVRVENHMLAFGDFIRGIRWADEHPKEGLVDIKKVLVFLRGIRLDYYVEHNDELVNALRKAIEE